MHQKIRITSKVCNFCDPLPIHNYGGHCTDIPFWIYHHWLSQMRFAKMWAPLQYRGLFPSEVSPRIQIGFQPWGTSHIVIGHNVGDVYLGGDFYADFAYITGNVQRAEKLSPVWNSLGGNYLVNLASIDCTYCGRRSGILRCRESMAQMIKNRNQTIILVEPWQGSGSLLDVRPCLEQYILQELFRGSQRIPPRSSSVVLRPEEKPSRFGWILSFSPLGRGLFQNRPI